jgi:hypothetical protein
MSTPHQSDAIEMVPATNVVETTMHTIETEADVKHNTQHVETASITRDKELIRDVDAQYTDGDDGKPRTGWRKLLRTNPTLDFMRDVAEANAEPLDPVEVKKVERKLYWLIVPPLFIE